MSGRPVAAVPTRRAGEEKRLSKAGLEAPESFYKEKSYRSRLVAWSILALSFAGSIAAVIADGGAIAVFLAAVLGGLMLASIAMPRLALAAIALERELPEAPVRDGEPLAVRIRMRTAFPLPFVWLAVREEIQNGSLPAGEGRTAVRMTPFSVTGRDSELSYTVAARRGVYRFSGIEIYAGDMFGLTVARRTVPCPGAAVAWPASCRVEADPASHAGMAAKGTGSSARIASLQAAADPADEWHSRKRNSRMLQGKGPDSRPYREGDSLRAIDWRSAAKGRGLRTKVHPLEQEAELVIVLDTAAEAYRGDSRLFDAAAAYAALAVEQAAMHGVAVRLLAGGGPAARHEAGAGAAYGLGMLMKPHAGTEPLMLKLAEAQAGGAGPILAHDELAALQERLPSGSVIVCITADNGSGDRLEQMAAQLGQAGAELKACIVTREASPTPAMRIKQRDMEQRGLAFLEWLPVPETLRQAQAAKGGARA